MPVHLLHVGCLVVQQKQLNSKDVEVHRRHRWPLFGSTESIEQLAFLNHILTNGASKIHESKILDLLDPLGTRRLPRSPNPSLFHDNLISHCKSVNVLV